MVAPSRFAIVFLLASVNAFSLLHSLLNFYGNTLSQLASPEDTSSSFPNPDEKPVPGNSPIIQCDALTKQVLTLQKVVIDPDTPTRGQNLTFVASGFLKEDIVEGAYVDVDVRYGFIRLIHQTFDLCEEVQNVDMECPINKGQQLISKLVEIPNEVPPGKYIVNARAYTVNDELITCLSATVEFPPS